MKCGTFISLLALLTPVLGDAGWTYFGCVEGTDILSKFSLFKFDEPILPEDCTTVCEDKHYANAALSNGICYCGSNLPTPISVDEKLCTLPCIVDSGQFCGGSPTDPSSPVALYKYGGIPTPSWDLVPDPTLRAESTSSFSTVLEPESALAIAEITPSLGSPTASASTYQLATDLTAKFPLPIAPAPTPGPENEFYAIQTGLKSVFPLPTKPTGLAPRLNGGAILLEKWGVNGTLKFADGSTESSSATGALETEYLNSGDRSGFVQFSSANENARKVGLVGAVWLLAGVLGFMMML